MVSEHLKNKAANWVSLFFFVYACKTCGYQPFIEWRGRVKSSNEVYSFLLENRVDRDQNKIISPEESSLLYKILNECRESPKEARWETLSPPYSSWEELQRMNCAQRKFLELSR